ncbi:hypothetical protein CKM354_001126100 [Cercospora kikuchii]|uniref:Uncharacterized protein n=1 Tax=Cercospora kikuchii TaxID=84275 RepID=A0A9P3CY98_9PEZI|nr:uncharacterized protein CKM354_001126100 [Cercospora kikuchii]GIZ48190.1 hypothetical protein CKM354_001126100 [Cercospora kikuchii]
MGDMGSAMPDLHSAQSRARLRAIASARRRGIAEHIALPQLIVCGDQSAGKSSVLERITGIPFPRQDGLCTRFATEIILEDEDAEMSISVAIIPHSTQTEERKTQMLQFSRSIESFAELPLVIAHAGTAMGVKGFASDEAGPSFARDVLQIRASGRTGLHLSVVDLPGIIQVPSEDQTEADVDAVHALVDTYMQNPRSIILAVVQAGNDIANQPVIRKSKMYDHSGERTIGIITKPDLINRGTEGRIALLARNEDTTRLKLGFFLLKNPSPEQMKKGISQQESTSLEHAFFESLPWNQQDLDPGRIGVSNLKEYLQTLLDRHIEKEMPRVRQDLRDLRQKTSNEIEKMGSARLTIADMRVFLSRLAMRFDSLCSSALQGNYGDSDFFGASGESIPPTRLRAVVHASNVKYSDLMRTAGEKRKIKGHDASAHSYDSLTDSEGPGEASEGNDVIDEQVMVTELEFRQWIKEVYMKTRGRELPGEYNHVFLAELFHQHSSRWLRLAANHLNHLYECLDRFVEAVISYLSNEEHTRSKLRERIAHELEKMKVDANKELARLWNDESQQPLTYNHYYTDNIQKARNDAARKALKKAMDETTSHDYHGRVHISNNSIDIQTFLTSLQKRVVVDMDEQACSEARAALAAYYKVARKTFVDNLCRQAIERHLLRDLPSVFSPQKVAACSDEELRFLAGESKEAIEKRERLLRFHAVLEECLLELP